MSPLTDDALDLSGGAVMVWRAEDEQHTRRRVQACPEGAGEVRVAIRDEHVRQSQVAEHRHDEVASCRLGCCGLECRDQPHVPSQEIDVDLQKVMPGAGDGQLEKVKADTPAESRGDRQGNRRPAGRRWSV